MLDNKVIGFIGAGSMTKALLRGIIESGTVQPDHVLITNRTNSERLVKLVEAWDVVNCTKGELLRQADVVVLAVKPKDVAAVMEEIGPLLTSKQVLISVAAGIPTSFIEGFCREKIQVIRAMPNTSCTVLASATAISRGKFAKGEAELLAKELFKSVGTVDRVAEELLDVITGLSGSGPAYVYFMVEALEQAGAKLGLSREMASTLATQTVFGAAKMLLETGEQPEKLRAAVTSPGGTTLAGLQALSAYNFTEALFAAVQAATKRSKEMGLEFTGLVGGAIGGCQ